MRSQSVPLGERLRGARRSLAIGPAFVFLGFLALVLLMGGSARGDVASLLLIRPMAALALTYGLLQLFAAKARGDGPSGLRFLIVAVAAIVVLAAIQLIPLPPSIWASLPGRAPLVAGHDAAQIVLAWQPLSVTPMATINALGAVLVPFAVLVLFAAVDDKARENAVLIVGVFVGLSAVIEVIQSLVPGSSALHFYRVTNEDAPVGLFANRNHHAVMLAATIPLILAIMAQFGKAKLAWMGGVASSCVVGLCMVGLAVMTGSRAGAALSIAAFALTVPLFTYAKLSTQSGVRNWRRKRWALILSPIGIVLIVVAVFLIGGGAAFERIAAKDSFGDLRFQILPDILAMIAHSTPLGWGMGSFPEVYEIYERREMIQPAYINHAHNDWLEIIIEGGLALPTIMAAIAMWTAQNVWRHRRQILRPRGDEGRVRFAGLAGAVILVAGSAFDYPLRTPSGAVVMVLFLALIAAPHRGSAPS
ncbi:MAG: O-antigen ligase family protein [Erythrobacter sp.]